MKPIPFFEILEDHWKQELPFVVYRKPNESDILAILQNNDTLHVTKTFDETGFVFAPFDSKKEAILLQLDQQLSCAQNTEFLKKQEQNPKDQTTNSEEDEAKKARHLSLIQKAMPLLKEDQLQKVVLSRKEKIEVENKEPFEKFRNLVVHYPTAMVYCWYHPKVGLWLGATPETLVRIKNDVLHTMALAGTQLYQGDMTVSWGEKEQQEQQLVTDELVRNLATVVTNSIVSKPYTHRAGSLLHIRTDFSAQLHEFSLQQLLRILHPTPAVCGLPKEPAKRFILKNESYDREFYTGFLGELKFSTDKVGETSETNLFVNLRCMQLENNKAVVYVGGGITKASVPEKEWEETVKKTNTMKKVL